MATKQFADAASREAFWRGHVEGWSTSGQSIRGYCQAQGVNEACFHYWKSALKTRDGQSADAGRLPFAEVRVTASDEALLEVVVSGSRRVHVRPGFDAETLARVVAVLEREAW